MNFDTVLDLRTETSNQPGVVVLQFLPEQNIGAQNLTLSSPPQVAAGLEVGARYNWATVKVEPGDDAAAGPQVAMSFAASLSRRTETASQRGVAVLEFTPGESNGAAQLTMSVPAVMAADLIVGANYRFDATKVEDAVVDEDGEGADG